VGATTGGVELVEATGSVFGVADAGGVALAVRGVAAGVEGRLIK
jgi:hypothetical protein